jgi:hypothetical protein
MLAGRPSLVEALAVGLADGAWLLGPGSTSGGTAVRVRTGAADGDGSPSSAALADALRAGAEGRPPTGAGRPEPPGPEPPPGLLDGPRRPFIALLAAAPMAPSASTLRSHQSRFTHRTTNP